jgi:Ca2+-binding RTX toxin-like protein
VPILDKLVALTENVDGLNGIYEGFKNLRDADGALEVTAATSQIFAEFAVAGLVTATLRPAFSAYRLGLALSGQIWKWEAMTSLAGAASGISAGKLIDIANKQNFGSKFYDWTHPIGDSVHTPFSQAKNWVPRRDPLILDLTGNGLETVGVSAVNPIYFDHDGDGVKTNTGWLLPSDGFLVMDRNGNGLIDNGIELFGDSTPRYLGGHASDGFEALAQEDTNSDGLVNKDDANWSLLKVWRDLNQDGVSQSDELLGLAAVGIKDFTVAKTENSTILPNGNQIADLGSYGKVDGGVGTIGEIGNLADIDLAERPYDTVFTDSIPVEAGLLSLNGLSGSGQVREIREAASMGSIDANILKSTLISYMHATSRSGQRNLLDEMIYEWSSTSSMKTSIETNRQLAHQGGNAFYGNIGVPEYDLRSTDTAIERYAQNNSEWYKKIVALERFNGENFLEKLLVPFVYPNGGVSYSVEISTDQYALLSKSWEALKETVYVSLLPQTRFHNLLGLVDFGFNGSEIFADFTKVNKYFDVARALDPSSEIVELAEFNLIAKDYYADLGWQGWSRLATELESAQSTPELIEVMRLVSLMSNQTEGGEVIFGGDARDVTGAGSGIDTIFGMTGNDDLSAGAGDDNVFGMSGDDTLSGGAGADLLQGGTGNDLLDGGVGNDTYGFSIGSGIDRISDYDTTAGNTDTVSFADVASTALTSLERKGNDLVVKYGTSDQVTVGDYFDPNYLGYKVEQFQFSDGVTWNETDIKSRVITSGDASNNVISGYNDGGNRIYGLGGNDVLYGGVLADLVDGGIGDDSLSGNAGDDQLFGGAGNDALTGGAGNDTLDGGTGNDTLEGSAGNDTYRFATGSGVDRISDYDTTTGNIDVVQFLDGIASDQLWLRKVSSNLELSIIGSSDTVTLSDWYLGGQYHVEQIKTSDGKTLMDSKVQNLVDAMAAFAPPAAGQTTLSASYADSLNPVLAANWQ